MALAAKPSQNLMLGLRANWKQFALLVVINAFVGGMVGLERSTLPLLAESEFGLTSKAAAVSFIASFGFAKALTNLFSGHLAGRFTRKKLLVAGWLVGLPVPFILIWAPSWDWVVGANLLLGMNQGLTWSMTVNMKIDLVGPKQRGLALGFNEAAGYMAVAAAAYLSGIVASHYDLRPEPFYLGIAFASVGLALSVLAVRDTSAHVALESAGHKAAENVALAQSFANATWKERHLWGISQAGFVNNLNDGLIWGLFPLYFASRGLSIERIAVLAAAYPLVWGALQLITGWLSDKVGRPPLIVGGMLLQGVAIWMATSMNSYALWVSSVALVGVGTAMVYPTLLAAIGDQVHPAQRSSTLGVYRFWRDAGAMAGALVGGGLADLFDFSTAIQVVAALTVTSGVLAAWALRSDPAKEHSTVEVRV